MVPKAQTAQTPAHHMEPAALEQAETAEWVCAILREQNGKGGIAAAWGNWPGDESDEEIAKLLEEIS